MSPYPQADLSDITTIPIGGRKSKIRTADVATVYDPRRQSFSRFVDSLPDILAAADLRRLVTAIVRARKRKKPVIVMMGAHVIKVGLAPLLVDLAERGIVTGFAMNSAASIHDVELAMWGKTSEDVEANIPDGTFGMSRETGELINCAISDGVGAGSAGYGECLGIALRRSPGARRSILATSVRLGIPVTVHAAIGTDIIHQQPTMDGAATGEMTFRDFRVFCEELKSIGNGGVVINLGSAVIMPEVFLKALTVARNLGAPAHKFTTANFDMLRHYRPLVNVVQRPTRGGGTGYTFTGHHEIMVPLLCAMIKNVRGGR